MTTGYVRIPHFRVKLVKDRTYRYPLRLVSGSDAAAEVIRHLLKDSPNEQIVVVYLNTKNEIVGTRTIAQGGVCGAAFTPRDLLVGAFESNASAIVLGHNHPSGDPTPSHDDIHATVAAARACEIVGIELLDHVVVTRSNGWRSIRDVVGSF